MRQAVRERVGLPAFEAWFRSLEGDIEAETLVIRCPDRFSRDWIRGRYGRVIEAAAPEVQAIEYRLEGAAPETARASGARPRRAEPAAPAQTEPDSSFESFVVGPGNALALEAARAVARGEAGRCSPLALVGRSGVGKTHLAVAILQGLMERGFSPLFCDYKDLLKQILASYNKESQTTEFSVLGPVLECEILVLDDLGAGKLTTWVLDTVGHILNTRYNERRTTIITTNYLDRMDREARPAGRRLRQEDSLADRVGERIRSRLYEMCRLVEIQSVDFRPTIKRA